MPKPPRFPTSLTVVAIVFGWLIATGAAHAEDTAATAAAREHYQKGTAFFDLGKYQDAIKEFEAAYEAKNDPAFLYNLAQSYRLAGNPEQALRFYKTYLRKNPKPQNRADIEEKIAQLEKLVDQKTATQTSPPTHTIQPALPGSPNPGGPSAPTTPPAPPLTSTAPPAAPPAETPPAPPPTWPPSNTSQPPTAQPSPYPGALPPPAPAPEKKRTSGLRLTGWILGGAGVVSVIVGAAYGQGAQSAAKEIKDAAAANKMYTADLEAVDQRGRTDQTLEFVFLSVGAVALAGGIVCYFMGAPAESATGGQVSFLPTVSPNGGSASLRVTF
ncbi:MAG: hypothetical protein QOI66_1037 [Myxococcales bacterium]|nr:hypothetical protein [Myxococcales bacterium]